MGRISGQDAAIDGIGCLKNFRLLTRGIMEAESCSAGGGAVFRAEGNKDWIGAAVGLGHTPAKLPGDTFQFLGTDRAGHGWQSAEAGTIVDKVTIFAPVAASLRNAKFPFFRYQIEFSGNGSLTRSNYSAPSVGTAAPISAKDRGISFGDASMEELESWQLELIGNTSTPEWSSGSGGWPFRAPGDIDAILTWTQYFDSGATFPVLFAPEIYKAYVTADAYWELKWMQTQDVPVSYEIRTEDNSVGWVQGVQMKAYFTSYYSAAQGYIKKPDTSVFWEP